MGSYTSPPAAPVAIPRKRPWIALVLELFVPGAGAMYAGRVVTGFVWLVGTAAVGWYAWHNLSKGFLALPQALADPGRYVDTQPWVIVTLAAALVWLLVRCMLATADVRAYNVRMERRLTLGPGASEAEVDVAKGSPIKTLMTVLVEMIPGGIGPWGIGDIATAIEAIAGRTMDGLKLTFFERLLYFGASAIPLVPARPFVAIYRWIFKGGNPPSQQSSQL